MYTGRKGSHRGATFWRNLGPARQTYVSSQRDGPLWRRDGVFAAA